MEPTEIVDYLADEVMGFVDRRIASELRQLRAELAAERAASGATLSYRGIWQRADRYSRGAVVTHRDTIWFCAVAETSDPPGTSADWQMMVPTRYLSLPVRRMRRSTSCVIMGIAASRPQPGWRNKVGRMSSTCAAG